MTTTTHHVDAARADELRAAMVAELRGEGVLRSDRVSEAMGTVPRHVFAPGERLERVYATQEVLHPKRGERGVATSVVSAPSIQAMMLEQAAIVPGMRLLEVGSGGCNAAYCSELVGPSGEMTTVDIDSEIVDRARRYLPAAGYNRVNVVEADAWEGVPAFAPYDRIIVTTSAWEIPPAWLKQLSPGGLIIVPLRLRAGMTRSVVFERDGEQLVSRGYELCAFVPMQGIGSPAERVVALDGDDVGLRIDADQEVDDVGLRASLAGRRVEAWSQVTLTGEGRMDGLHLWLGTLLPGFGSLMAQRPAMERGVVAHAWPLGVPTAVDGDSFAYLGLRDVPGDERTCEFGAYGHGPKAEQLVDQVLDGIRSWDGTNLDTHIAVYPAGVEIPADELPGTSRVLNRERTRIVISWP